MIEGFLFSPELIQRIQKYFADRYGDYLTPEQAEEYLSSFAELFLALAGIGEDRRGGVPGGPRRDDPSS